MESRRRFTNMLVTHRGCPLWWGTSVSLTNGLTNSPNLRFMIRYEDHYFRAYIWKPYIETGSWMSIKGSTIHLQGGIKSSDGGRTECPRSPFDTDFIAHSISIQRVDVEGVGSKHISTHRVTQQSSTWSMLGLPSVERSWCVALESGTRGLRSEAWIQEEYFCCG